jgi:hypothetical protein
MPETWFIGRPKNWDMPCFPAVDRERSGREAQGGHGRPAAVGGTAADPVIPP